MLTDAQSWTHEFRAPGPRVGPGEELGRLRAAWESAPDAKPAFPHLSLAGTSPFVGREREMSVLEAMLRETASQSRGRVALVAGEPGIGKTRLLMELAERAASNGWLVLLGRAYESEGMPPYLPFTEALASHLRGVPDNRLSDELGDRAAELALILPDIARRLPNLAPLPALDPGSERYRLFEAVCDHLAALARGPGHEGLLLGIEDLHWADKSTLLLLEHLARRLHDAPIALLLNYRDTELEPGRPLARLIEQVARLTPCEHLPLRRLDVLGVSMLLVGLSGAEPPLRLVEVIYSESEGNPFFVHEVYHYLADEGRLFDSEGQWRSDVRVGEVEIPQGVRLVIGRRIQHVSDGCRGALTFAAIIGRVFDFDLLRDVSGMAESDLLDAMDEAERAHLVASGPQHGAAQLTFTHELIRQTLEGDLSLPRRRALHTVVAEAIERLYAHRLGPHVSQLALHYSIGGRAAHAEKAVEYATRAARQAMAVYAHQEAVRHYEMALDSLDLVAPDNDPRRCDLLDELGHVLRSAGEPGRAVELSDKAFKAAESLGDGARAVAACHSARLDMLHSGMGAAPHTELFRTWAARAEKHAALGTLDRARVCLIVGDTLVVADRRPRAWALYREAFEIALRNDDAELLYDIATQVGGWAAAPAHEQERYDIILEALKRPKAISSETLGRFLLYEGLNHMDWGDDERASTAWSELVALADRMQSAYLVQFAARTDIFRAIIQGRFGDAVAAADRLIARADESGGQAVGRIQSSNVVYRALLHLGKPEEALGRLDEAHKAIGLSVVPMSQAAARLATLAALVAEGTRSIELSDLATSYKPNADGDNWATYIFLSALEAALALDDRESVARLSVLLEPAGHLAIGFLAFACPARLLGDAAQFLWKPDEARGWYERAIEIAGKIGFRPEVALAHLGLAELIALGEALEHLAFAIKEFEAMEMTPALLRARALQERLAGRAPARHAHPDGLSDREAEVLRLIAGGKSNRQIADELVLSVRTVERHIANLYTKIGASTKAQATAYAFGHNVT